MKGEDYPMQMQIMQIYRPKTVLTLWFVQQQGNCRSRRLYLLAYWSLNKKPLLCVSVRLSVSSSYVCHGVRPLVDPFRSHVSRSLFRGLPRFLLLVGEQCFIILGSPSRDILFTCCIQFLLYSSSLSRTGVISNSFAMCKFVS